MCGICGIVGIAEPGSIDRMIRALAHRGPDDSGSQAFDSGRVTLGHTRLSILDLSSLGHQPMTDDQGRYWITYNGEVYNYQEVRATLLSLGYRFRSNTDTEVILYAFKEWGPACLERFNGMFAFAIWDKEAKRLFAARDRLGVKPFYYWKGKDHFVFASEIKAMFATGLVHPEVDHDALYTPAMYQTAPYTGFKQILKLLPAHYLILEGDRIETHCYWKIEPSTEVTDLAQATEQLDALLRDAVKLQMVSDVPVGLLLSGGLDSSLLLALMSQITPEPVQTFTVSLSSQDQRQERMFDDSKFARVAAERFGSRHTDIQIEPDIVNLLPKIMWHLDEPLSDPAAINTYLLCKEARARGVVVMLNGSGADEVFGGYRNYLACLLAERYQSLVPEIGRNMIKRVVEELPVTASGYGLRTVRWAKRFLAFASLPESVRFMTAATMPPSEFAALFGAEPRNGDAFHDTIYGQKQLESLDRKNLPYLARMCLTYTSSYLTDHNLLYADKASMAASVESRPPFTDHRIVEFMFSVHSDLKIKGRVQKVLLRNAAARYLPREITHRPKAPFGAPLRAWIRGPLAQMIGDYLSRATLKERGIYDVEYVWKKIENDRKGTEDNAHLIWRLLCNEVWLRTLFAEPVRT